MDGWLNYALDGGPDGRKTIYCFLRGVGAHLRPGGRALLLASSLTGIKEVVDMAKGLGLTPEELFRERYFFEDLVVLRITE
jgi:release factor glutamine methyltransferase